MKKFLTQGRLAALIVFAVLLIDQVIKIWIKLICICMRISM